MSERSQPQRLFSNVPGSCWLARSPSGASRLVVIVEESETLALGLSRRSANLPNDIASGFRGIGRGKV